MIRESNFDSLFYCFLVCEELGTFCPLFFFFIVYSTTHFTVDPILFSEEQSSKKETVECQPGTSGENNAEDQVPKPIRYC